MAYISLDTDKLKANFNYLDKLFKKRDIHWSIVTKLLCGNKDYIQEVLQLNINQVCDSRVSNLKLIKTIRPDIETVYIKPPARRAVRGVVRYADISMNTELETLKILGQEAQRQGKVHKVIIMVELGELREGIMRDSVIDLYDNVFKISHIEVVGIGANLSCLYGILPNQDKLIQLCLYQQLIEAKFNKKIQYVSGGSSVTIPLIFQRLLPKGINHFRVGETLFCGTDVYNDTTLKKMRTDVFVLFTEIIELIEKPQVPVGEFGTNLEGDTPTFDDSLQGKTSFRALIDVGLLDIDRKHLMPADEDIAIVGGSSDMLVIDLGDNPKKYKVGDELEFKVDYMGILRLLNSKYIDKRIRFRQAGRKAPC